MKSKRGLRLAVGGAVLGAVYLGLAASAMAWNEPLWVRQLGTDSWDFANGVATDAAGNVYLSGWIEILDPNRGEDIYDAWVAKYDAAGHVLWKRQLDSDGGDSANGVATDAAGDVYLTGSTDGSLGGANRGAGDAWLAKYDAAGHRLWKRQLGTETSDGAASVATDAAGNVYLTGETWGSLGGPNRGGLDAWVVKYDASGHVLWRRQLGTEGDDSAASVATDAGNVYLAGGTNGSLGGPYRGGNDNAWMAKYDAAGHLLWKRQLGTETELGDSASGVATDAKGNVYLAGWTAGSLGGANRGVFDAWVAKYSTQR